MPSTGDTKVGGIGSAAVAKATGKTWQEWLKALDKAGCRKMNHQEIVAVLAAKFGIGSWWRQMVTVGYEQARGLREKHQKANGFEISRTRTVAVNVREAFRAWADKRTRRRWLADADFTIHKSSENKLLRTTWVDNLSHLDVYFSPKSESKCQVSVQHNKLKDAKTAERMKKYWTEQLERLRGVLEA